MRALRCAVAGLVGLTLLTVAGCSGRVTVNSQGNASAKVPPGQVVKQGTPGHNK